MKYTVQEKVLNPAVKANKMDMPVSLETLNRKQRRILAKLNKNTRKEK